MLSGVSSTALNCLLGATGASLTGATFTVAVARNADEAARLARGEDIKVARTEEQEAAAEALATAETFFDPEAPQARASEETETPAEDSK